MIFLLKNDMENNKKHVYALEVIQAGLERLDLVCNDCEHLAKKQLEVIYTFIKPFIVYKLEDMGDYYLPLNREYKPLGCKLHQLRMVKYENYPHLLIPKDMVNADNLKENKWFWTDGIAPRTKKDLANYVALLYKTFPTIDKKNSCIYE